MKKRTKRIIAVLSIAAAALLFLIGAQEFWLRRIDNGVVRMEGFYKEDKNSLDVVFIGASEVYQGFACADAYRLFGFTSYPIAFETNPVTLWKYELKEALKHQSPKLVVVELNGSVYGKDNLYKSGAVRYLADAMPLSENKVELVKDMGVDSPASYYFPIIKYHGNFKKKDFRNILDLHLNGHNILRGAFSHSFNDKTPEEMDVRGDKSTKDLDPVAEERLREFLEYCSEPGMPDFLFVRFPHQTNNDRTYARLQRYNRAGEIVKEYGFNYVDFDESREEIGLIKDEDFYNGEHLNARGMKKFTPFLAKYLVDNCGIGETMLTEKQKAEWDESARYIEKFYDYYEVFLAEHQGEKDKGKNLWDNHRTLKAIEKLLAEE